MATKAPGKGTPKGPDLSGPCCVGELDLRRGRSCKFGAGEAERVVEKQVRRSPSRSAARSAGGPPPERGGAPSAGFPSALPEEVVRSPDRRPCSPTFLLGPRSRWTRQARSPRAESLRVPPAAPPRPARPVASQRSRFGHLPCMWRRQRLQLVASLALAALVAGAGRAEDGHHPPGHRAAAAARAGCPRPRRPQASRTSTSCISRKQSGPGLAPYVQPRPREAPRGRAGHCRNSRPAVGAALVRKEHTVAPHGRGRLLCGNPRRADSSQSTSTTSNPVPGKGLGKGGRGRPCEEQAWGPWAIRGSDQARTILIRRLLWVRHPSRLSPHFEGLV